MLKNQDNVAHFLCLVFEFDSLSFQHCRYIAEIKVSQCLELSYSSKFLQFCKDADF